jgi:hypothetical protein
MTQPGDRCTDTVGQPTCAPGQGCVEFDAGYGGCLRYCDPGGATCDPGGQCVAVKLGLPDGSPFVHVCTLPPVDAAVIQDGGVPEAEILDVRTELPM